MNRNYDINSADSIIGYAKKLKGQTLRTACGQEIETANYKGKGNFGQLLEKFYFGYEPNSDANADFKEVGLELKASPLKILKNGEFRSKERLVLNIINYLEVHNEKFENSAFWQKNAHLLLVFYLHDKEKHLLDYLIKLVNDWKYPAEDLEIIKQDWEKINQKIKDGKAHELSEGDTFYLGACTKGSSAAKSFRDQPFNTEKAKQRAYSLKQGYVNHIIANIAREEQAVYGKIIKLPTELTKKKTLEEIVIDKFNPFYGKSAKEIAEIFDLHFNPKAKNYFASITNAVLKAILGVEQDKTIEEFEKADIQVKTIRVEQNNRIQQSVSFPAFEFIQIYNESWRESELKYLTEKKFLFLFFKNNGNEYVFDKAKFWNMPFTDRNEVRKVWLKTKKVIQTGEIIKGYKTDKNGKVSRLLNFPKKTESNVWHVRPHGQTALDTKPLPVMEKETKEMSFTKQCFWMNWDYLRDEIYLK
jgi:DNA mismatch repair protein MutH